MSTGHSLAMKTQTFPDCLRQIFRDILMFCQCPWTSLPRNVHTAVHTHSYIQDKIGNVFYGERFDTCLKGYHCMELSRPVYSLVNTHTYTCTCTYTYEYVPCESVCASQHVMIVFHAMCHGCQILLGLGPWLEFNSSALSLISYLLLCNLI